MPPAEVDCEIKEALRRVDDLLVIRCRQMYVREIDLSTGRTTAVVRPVETKNL